MNIRRLVSGRDRFYGVVFRTNRPPGAWTMMPLKEALPFLIADARLHISELERRCTFGDLARPDGHRDVQCSHPGACPGNANGTYPHSSKTGEIL